MDKDQIFPPVTLGEALLIILAAISPVLVVAGYAMAYYIHTH